MVRVTAQTGLGQIEPRIQLFQATLYDLQKLALADFMGRCRFGLRDGFDRQLVPLLVYNESFSNQPSLSVFGAGHTEQLITTLSDGVISRVLLFARAPLIPTRCTITEPWKRTLLAWSCSTHSLYQVLAMGRAEETQHC